MVRAESGLGHANETKNDGTGEPSGAGPTPTFPMMAYQLWTQEMDTELISLLSSGTPSLAIALTMERSELAICQRIMILHNRNDLVMLPSARFLSEITNAKGADE